ncbi:MAG: hypothetical protein GC168_16955 [Candidatus Hydrogenedens sp.]|nr:hypothetical protein [Candidatus Hydrogenedens sp.]
MKKPQGWALYTIFGIALPALAVTIEFVYGCMRYYYIDPMPTAPLFLLLCLVPVTFLYIFLIVRSRQGVSGLQQRLAFLGSGALVVLTGAYSIFYIPTIPLAILAVVFMGFGFLGLSPHFAFLFSFYAVQRLRVRYPACPGSWVFAGAVLMGLILAGYFGRMSGIEHGMILAASDRPAEVKRGYEKLNRLGGARYVLDRCYYPVTRSNMFNMDAIAFDAEGNPQRWRSQGFGTRATQEDAQRAYFVLTGNVFTSQRAPWRMSDRWGSLGLPTSMGIFAQQRDWRLGSEDVGGELPGLALAESRLDGNLHAGASGGSGESTAYLEWVMTFANSGPQAREARTLLHLPPGAVASRLTLWINGEEREAAFGGREQVQAAYREVAVVRRQDPALLTTQGPDRVLLQCFPVPARGTMKVKLGVTVPMLVRDGQAYLRLPDIVERNYAFAESGAHHVWMEAPAAMTTDIDTLAAEQVNGTYALRGEVPFRRHQDDWLGWVAVPAQAETAVFAASLGELNARMAVSPAADASLAEGPVWLVVDSSASMAHAATDWQEFLSAFPADTRFHAMMTYAGNPAFDTSDPAALIRWIEAQYYGGGHDPMQALETSWDEASGTDGSRLIWVHGPFPLARPATAGIEQLMMRRPPVTRDGRPRLFDVQVSPGPNRVLEMLGPVRGLVSVPVVNGLGASLRYLAEHGRLEDIQREYTLVDEPAADVLPGTDHLVRLAVNDTVLGLLAGRDSEAAKEAAALAVRTRLVTPVSGAVVLERQEQYERHGLDPGENQDAVAQIPAVPEPEEWALIIIACIALVVLLVRRARQYRTPLRWEAAV